jgi:hypothetical protein
MNSKTHYFEKKKFEEICRLSNFIPEKFSSKNEKKAIFDSFELLWSFHEKIFKKLETFQK